MYPLYWTHQLKGVLFMKYSYEYKKQCVMLYRQGKWPEIPKDIRTKTFRNMIRTWVRIELNNQISHTDRNDGGCEACQLE